MKLPFVSVDIAPTELPHDALLDLYSACPRFSRRLINCFDLIDMTPWGVPGDSMGDFDARAIWRLADVPFLSEPTKRGAV